MMKFSWVPLTEIDDIEKFNEAEAYIHRAAQFPAAIGRNYLPHKDDDSNTNLKWNPLTGVLSSRIIPRKDGDDFQLGIDVEKFELIFQNGLGEELNTIRLNGQTKEQLMTSIQVELDALGMDSHQMDFISHYEVPEHEVDKGHPFVKPDEHYLKHWVAMRTNAEILNHHCNQYLEKHAEIRVWPHHFDTGIYNPVNKAGDKSIGAGWAIADGMVNEPYFYIYGWQKEAELGFNDKPKLPIGHWIVKEWKGAVLPISDLIKADNQEGMALAFCDTVLEWYRKQLA